MDNPSRYRALIVEYLEEHAQYPPSYGEITPVVIMDEARDHFLLMHIGWTERARVHSVILHIHLTGGKIWIEHDGTPPPGAAMFFVEAGVPREAIVLAFYHARTRADTDFAVA